MKISLDWLKDYVDYTGTVAELVELLTHVGFPVEETHQVGDDWMLDVEVTSNRPDCLGHIGIAREVAAAAGLSWRLPEVNLVEDDPKDVSEYAVVKDEALDLCSRYTARVVTGVKVGPSPDWMVRRLETIGLRSINNVVDITNYILMEIGQPIHSFDYNRLENGMIIVRRADEEEVIETIDHTQHKLNADMLVIADASRPVAVAGVMGGVDSEVSEETSIILMESAHFNPLSVRKTSRALALSSDSSFRFERNVDWEMAEWASQRSCALLRELAGGKIARGVIDLQDSPPPARTVALRMERLKLYTGIDFKPDYVTAILGRLGFEPNYNNGLITCQVPSWRYNDVSQEVDLIEEVIRIHGFEPIATENSIHIRLTTPDKFQKTRESVVSVLHGCGYFETISVAFIEDVYHRPFTPDNFQPVRVSEYIRKENNALRSSLLPSLMVCRRRNQDSGNEACYLYELAATHVPVTGGGVPRENVYLSLLGDGDLRSMRGVLETLVLQLDRASRLTCRPAPIFWARPEGGAELVVNDKVIGVIGVPAEPVMKAYDLEKPLCLAEIDFSALIELQGAIPQLKPLIRFPAIIRDLSLVLDEPIRWIDLEQAIRLAGQCAGDNLRDVRFIGIYRGKGIEKGKKSLTLSMEFRRAEGTLTHEEVDGWQQTILTALKGQLAADLRV